MIVAFVLASIFVFAAIFFVANRKITELEEDNSNVVELKVKK